MLGARFLSGLMLDELIIDDADALTREDAQDFAVALAFRRHIAVSTRKDIA
jgi:hypothetical protein